MATTVQSQPQIESLGHLTLPPHSTDAEAALLGGMMLDPEGQAYDKVASIVTERDFYHPENKAVFTAIQKQFECFGNTLRMNSLQWTAFYSGFQGLIFAGI